MNNTELVRGMTVLMADDDQDDRILLGKAWEQCRLSNPLRFVCDGEELMEYLEHRGAYADPAIAPRPGLILLDLNMPRKDGLEALREIRASYELRNIPVVVLTTSKAEEDILKTYNLGVNSFITKPVSFSALIETIRTLGEYWFSIVRLPPN